MTVGVLIKRFDFGMFFVKLFGGEFGRDKNVEWCFLLGVFLKNFKIFVGGKTMSLVAGRG